VAIFIVEDQREQAELLQKLFERMGHHARIETSGIMALKTLQGPSEFDVTFLDVLMPDMTGGVIYNELKKSAPARLKRLVFLTGMAYMVENWLRATGLPVIDKPASPERLAATVREFSELKCTRGPRELKEENGEIMPAKPPHPSHPELADLIDDDVEIDTDMLELAHKKGASASLMTELRIRHLHTGHKKLSTGLASVDEKVDALKTDVAATKTDLGTVKTEIKTTITTSQRWLAFIVVGAGAAWAILEHFLFPKR
jgi:CheY-like chemotaxis protein